MANHNTYKILLVEDDRNSREAISDWLTEEGYDVVSVANGQDAIRHIHDGIAVVVTDLKMPKTDGLELLELLRRRAPHAAVIMITGHASAETAVAALKNGAFDYLQKPVVPEELSHRIEMAIEKSVMAAEIAKLHAELSNRKQSTSMIGRSDAMRAIFEKIKLVAKTNASVLVVGESGTGKELVAQAIHQQSDRNSQPFVPVNCAAIPESLIESELFGHEKGAFTGATHRKDGLFQAARGGTLFIDEIGEMQLGLQAKLLRALENKKVMPVGSAKEIDVDVRVVAATNRDLKKQVDDGNFREDLYYRLKVVELRLPPLKERRDDIPLLTHFFIKQFSSEHKRNVNGISAEALDALKGYDWPGNIRELRNMLESIIVLCLNDIINIDDLPEHVSGAESVQTVIKTNMTMEEIEREAIRRSLERNNGHRGKTSESLAIPIRTLHRKIKEYGLGSD